MSAIKDLAYDIEQLYIEGLHPTKIAKELDCPLTVVYDWLESCSLEADVADSPQEDEIYSPYYGA
jgi:DNA-directed RNA polymerase specialized sigma24 family protein